MAPAPAAAQAAAAPAATPTLPAIAPALTAAAPAFCKSILVGCNAAMIPKGKGQSKTCVGRGVAKPLDSLPFRLNGLHFSATTPELASDGVLHLLPLNAAQQALVGWC